VPHKALLSRQDYEPDISTPPIAAEAVNATVRCIGSLIQAAVSHIFWPLIVYMCYLL
jgi:hypothetical protein